MSFSDFFTRKVPTTLRRATWAKYLGALGAQLDGSPDGDYVGRGSAPFDWGLVARAKAAVKARFPQLAPADAQQQIGIERKMPSGPGESTDSYGARLQAAWDTWPWAGTAFGLLSALKAGGYPKAEVRIQNALRYSLVPAQAEERVLGVTVLSSGPGVLVVSLADAALLQLGDQIGQPGLGYPGAGFVNSINLANGHIGASAGGFGALWDAGPADVYRYVDTEDFELSVEQRPVGEWWIDWKRTFWSRFVVLLYPPFPFTGSTPADGSAEQQRVARLVRQWKSAHSTCTDIFVIESGRTWDSYPAGATWDNQLRATWDDDLAVLTRWSPIP